jgi:hypothetical protein
MATTTWNIDIEGAAKDMVLTGVTNMALVVLPWPTKYTLEPDITYGTMKLGPTITTVDAEAALIPVAGKVGQDVGGTPTLDDVSYIAGDAARGIGPRTHYEPTLGYMFVFTGSVPEPVAPRYNAAVVTANASSNLFTGTAHLFDSGDLVSYHSTSAYPTGISPTDVYTVTKVSADVFGLLLNGVPVDISDTGSGTQTVTLVTPSRLPATIPNAVFVPMSWGPKLTNTVVA